MKPDTRQAILKDLADLEMAPVHNSIDHQSMEELVDRARVVLKPKKKKKPYVDPRQLRLV